MSDLVRARLVAIVGIDGSGKTTAVEGVVAAMRSQGGDVVAIGKAGLAETVVDDRYRGMIERQSEVLWRSHGSEADDAGDAYWWLSQLAWFSLVDSLVVRPAVRRGALAIADEWYYKILARFLLKPAFPPELLALADSLRPADSVVLLDVDPTEAATRKGEFGFAESGGSDGHDAGAETRVNSFVEYQTSVRDVLLRLAAELNWSVIRVGGADEAQVVGQILDEFGVAQGRGSEQDGGGRHE